MELLLFNGNSWDKVTKLFDPNDVLATSYYSENISNILDCIVTIEISKISTETLKIDAKR